MNGSSADADAATSPVNGDSSAKTTNGHSTNLVDDELSEIIDSSDYNENCRFVGDYRENSANSTSATAQQASTSAAPAATTTPQIAAASS